MLPSPQQLQSANEASHDLLGAGVKVNLLLFLRPMLTHLVLCVLRVRGFRAVSGAWLPARQLPAVLAFQLRPRRECILRFTSNCKRSCSNRLQET